MCPQYTPGNLLPSGAFLSDPAFDQFLGRFQRSFLAEPVRGQVQRRHMGVVVALKLRIVDRLEKTNSA